MADEIEATDESSATELPEITCTLTEEEMTQRQAWAREHLLPHLQDIEERDDGYTIVFERSEAAYEAVMEVSWKESQCCSWATFEVELPPGDGPIRWHERSDDPEGTRLFGDGLAEFDEAAALL